MDKKVRHKERLADARAAASERVTEAKTAAADRVAGAKAATSERVSEAKAATEAFIAKRKPRLRGVSHEWAFFVSLIAGGVLVAAAPTPRATVAVGIYAASLSALLGVSALYHRVEWRRAAIRRWMRRLDHSMIFLLIAGTTTPFAVLVLNGALGKALLIAVWAGAAAGIVVELIWVDAPKWVTAMVYLAVGWIGALGFPAIVIEAGVGAGALIAAGGILYTAGGGGFPPPPPGPQTPGVG